jgi:predicted RecB family nuclease
MAAGLTRDVLEGFVFCKYKGYLKLLGQHGATSDYEALLMARRDQVRLQALATIHSQAQEDQIASNILLTTSALRRGPRFVLDVLIEDDQCALSVDGLKKVPGASKLGQFLYLPMLFHEGAQVHKEQRLLLALHALLLSPYQEIVPSRGIIWHGRGCRAATVRLDSDLRTARQIFTELQKMRSTEAAPRLVLNDHCQICEFRQRCRDQAIQEDNLSLLRGISEKEIRGYSRKGIFTITQLAHTFRPRRKGKRTAQGTEHRHPALQALALRDKRVYVLGTADVPSSPVCMYLDVEGDPDARFVYLIGLIIMENGSEKRCSFWADTRDQELDIFEQFLAEVTRREEFLVFCYGSYERDYIKRMRRLTQNNDRVDKVLNALVNVLSLIYAHIYFPTYSNGLKDIGHCIGCSWTEIDASGIQSIVWRARWEAKHSCGSCYRNPAVACSGAPVREVMRINAGVLSRSEDWKQKLMTYNLEDCAALKEVAMVLQRILTQRPSEEARVGGDGNNLRIESVRNIEKLTDFHKWKRVDFVHGDYEYINERAYFDYQRERVYIRTSKSLKSRRTRRKGSANRKLKASRSLLIIASECPVCQSGDVVSGIKKEIRTQEPRVKRAFDLVLTPTGIRRTIIECRTSVHQCLTCGEEFVPYQHQRLDKHFHGLKSWAMFQHVAYNISLKTLDRMFEDFFGLRIYFNEVHMFKSLMARYYETTYRTLLEHLLSGTLLHVDETEVKLQDRKGYVWVFTNLEEVVYMYRPTREGDFLRELLKGFHGVLVSDFYNAYDGIECPQQKCLIHLMRDINQVLLDNPFDEDLKAMTQPFGVLLRSIVSTIDEHGLKRHYLRKHEADVERYFRSLAEQSSCSDAAETLRLRLTKYRDKLFTFLHHDGVPWNNNNAEHAIKQFAYYREQTVGSMRESGLSNYLVLLSICQTCQYKGVSFLQFLLSKEHDVDVFRRRKQRRRRRSSIELYPEGFVPPHFASLRKKRSRQEPSNADLPASDETTQWPAE